MARATFGGTAADYVVTTGADGLLRLSSATLTMWTAATGGSQITDLRLGGSPVTSIPVGADGSVPTFQGPDGVTELWADAGHGRVRLTAPVTVVDSAVAALASNPGSALGGALSASNGALAAWAKNPDNLVTGSLTYDGSGLLTSAAVRWPDYDVTGASGTLTITSRQSGTNAVTGYTITRVVNGQPTKTYTQPTITRDATTGAATNVPAITVA